LPRQRQPVFGATEPGFDEVWVDSEHETWCQQQREHRRLNVVRISGCHTYNALGDWPQWGGYESQVREVHALEALDQVSARDPSALVTVEAVVDLVEDVISGEQPHDTGLRARAEHARLLGPAQTVDDVVVDHATVEDDQAADHRRAHWCSAAKRATGWRWCSAPGAMMPWDARMRRLQDDYAIVRASIVRTAATAASSTAGSSTKRRSTFSPTQFEKETLSNNNQN
jgi:hypothetical protein